MIAINSEEARGSAEARAIQRAERRVTMRTTRTRPRALTSINHTIQPQQPQPRNNNYSLTVSHGVISVTIPWSSIVAIACAVIVWLCYSVSGSTSLLLTSAALSSWVMQMTTAATRATPSGTHAEGGTVDLKTAPQAFTAIRLNDSPK
eukprot:1461206-Amphidinium_carterae.1